MLSGTTLFDAAAGKSDSPERHPRSRLAGLGPGLLLLLECSAAAVCVAIKSAGRVCCGMFTEANWEINIFNTQFILS